MDIVLDGGLNLSDPQALKGNQLAISQNVDFRKDGVARSRDGRISTYSNTDCDQIISANGNLFSFDDSAYKNGTSLGGSISTLSAIGKMALSTQSDESIFIAGLTNQKVEDDGTISTWGIVAPAVAPTLADSGVFSTNLNGTYYFKYTYVRKVGSSLVAESNPSPASLSIVVANRKIDVTITASSDSQVTHARIYRTLTDPAAGDADSYYFDIEITGTTGRTETADTALGTLIDTDNDRPPSGITAIGGPGAYNRLFLGASNRVYFTKSLKPESVPALNYIEVGTPFDTVQAVVDWGGLIYIFVKETIYVIQGTSPSTFYPSRTLALRGLFGKKAIASTEFGIVYLSYDGIYLFSGQREEKISGQVDALFRGDIVNGLNPLNKSAIGECWLAYFNNKLFLGYPDANNTLPNKVLVFDFDKKKWSIFDYGLTIISAYVERVESKLYVGDNNNNIWQLETGDDDAGSSFTLIIRSKEFSQTAKVTPSYVRYDIYNPGGNTIYARILSKGVVQNTQIITDSEEMRRRFISPSSYDRLAIELESSVSDKIEIGVIHVE